MYEHRKARLINLDQFPMGLLLEDYCYAVDEAVQTGYRYKSKNIQYLAIIYTVSGSSNYQINKIPCKIEPDSLLILPKGASFSEHVSSPKPCHNRYLMLNGKLIHTLNQLVLKKGAFFYFSNCHDSVRVLLERIILKLHEKLHPNPWKFCSLLFSLMDMLEQSLITPSSGSELKYRIKTIFERSPTNKISVPELAIKLGMSESAFAHKFKEETHIAPAKYIRELRCDYARKLLEQGHSVAETADLSGFRNPYHFSKFFKQVTGNSPSKFKRLYLLRK